MSKRKLQVAIFIILAVIFLGTLVGTFSRPAPVKVDVTFSDYTTAPSPFGPKRKGSILTNASFCVSNAGAATTRVIFRNYQLKTDYNLMFIRPSGLGTLCVLKPGQSTNLVVPIIPHITGIAGIGPDYCWRIEFTSRYDWLAKLDRQPRWLQNVVTKAIPRGWLGELSRSVIMSDWVTNRESTAASAELLHLLSNTNSVP